MSRSLFSKLDLTDNPVDAENPARNIIVFGQTGSGKSSLINMLVGQNVAAVSSGVLGCTSAAMDYSIRTENKSYTFWDTSGLNEGDKGSVPAHVAIQNLSDLALQISVNLIIYCVMGCRFPDIVRVNHDLFCGIICQGKVPMVFVVTGLEQEEEMDQWWTNNKKIVKRLGFTFEGHACVTTMKNAYESRYQESASKVWNLVGKHCNSTPWTMTPEWRAEVPKRIKQYMDNYNARTGKERKALPALRRPTPRSRKPAAMQPKSKPSGSGSRRSSRRSHNIILFGDAGSGKSSIVNMIVGKEVAKVSDDGLRCTLQTECYEAGFNEIYFSVYDTCGLNEGEQSRTLNWKAVEGLYTLIRQLDCVSLLIYCMRGKIKENAQANWNLFNRVICEEKVPIIAVVTGLENDEALEDEARHASMMDAFNKYNMRPHDLCCVVSNRGKRNEFQELYLRSQAKLRNLITDSYSKQNWSTDTDDWFARIYQNVYSTRMCFLPRVQREFVESGRIMIDKFIEESAMGADEASKLKGTLLRAEKKFLKK